MTEVRSPFHFVEHEVIKQQLEDAYAIIVPKYADYIKQLVVPNNCIFAIMHDPIIAEIAPQFNVEHDALSFCATILRIQYVLQHGFEAFINS
tara:strand:+ start:13187 stop:13462 length:276 start_codon:yes stop_codon:yes gene_type:complete